MNLSWINSILFLTFSLWAVIPFLQAIPYFTQISFLFIVAWLIIYLKKRGASLFEILILIITSYTFTIAVVTGNQEIGNRYIASMLSLLSYSAYKQEFLFSNKSNYRSIYTIIISSLIVCITTINALLENPFASRSIKSSGEYSINLLQNGVGGYSFIYYCVFLSIISIILYKATSSIRDKNSMLYILLVISIPTTFLTVVMSNYFTALILMTFGTVLILTTKIGVEKKSNHIKLALMLLASIFLFLFWKNLIDITIDGITQISGDAKTADRIRMLVASLTEDGDYSELTEGRDNVKETSINTFLDNPLFGVIINNYLISNDDFKIIGNHSFILDTFAFYGIILGFGVLLTMGYPFYKIIKNSRSKYIKTSTLIVMIIFFSLNYSNTFTPSICIASLYIFPAIAKHIDQALLKNKNSRSRFRSDN